MCNPYCALLEDHYYKGQWTFARGALATVDRPVFGWVGRFFLHNVNELYLDMVLVPNLPFRFSCAMTTSLTIFSRRFHSVRYLNLPYFKKILSQILIFHCRQSTNGD
jgi:hypothetical protein